MWDYHSGELLEAYPDDLSALRAHDEKLRAVFQAGAASRDAEVVSLTNQRDYEYVRAENAEQERDQLRAQINVLREALSSAESALDESRDYPVTYDGVITALITTHEQSLAEYRNKVIEECAVAAEQVSPHHIEFGMKLARAIRASEIALRIKTEEHQCCTEDLMEVRRSEQEGWKEAAIAWEVCASIHETWAKKKDALYSTRHADFEKHAEHARQKLTPNG